MEPRGFTWLLSSGAGGGGGGSGCGGVGGGMLRPPRLLALTLVTLELRVRLWLRREPSLVLPREGGGVPRLSLAHEMLRCIRGGEKAGAAPLGLEMRPCVRPLLTGDARCWRVGRATVEAKAAESLWPSLTRTPGAGSYLAGEGVTGRPMPALCVGGGHSVTVARCCFSLTRWRDSKTDEKLRWVRCKRRCEMGTF